MTAHIASLVNAASLILVSLWAYFANGMSSETTLIPVAFGVLLLACSPGLRAGGKVASTIAAVLTIVIFIALFTPLQGALAKEEQAPAMRVAFMIATTGWALFVFARTFVAARKKRP